MAQSARTALEILLLRISDFFALQEVIPCEIPLPRVLMRLPVLLRQLHLLGFSGNLILVQFVFFQL